MLSAMQRTSMVLIALLSVLPAACDSDAEATQASPQATSNVEKIDGARAHSLVTSGATLLDVRTPAEFSNGHAEGATNIPVSELEGRVDELPKDKPVVAYCRSGRRSAIAADLLVERGYTVYDLGTLDAWRAAE